MDKTFEKIYQSHHNMVYIVAYGILMNKQDAEDVSVEVFCRLYKCLRQNKDLQNVSGWLKVTTKSAAIDMIRKRRLIPETFEAELPAPDDFVESLISKVFADDMLNSLHSKNPQWFSYLTMHYILEMSYEEIASVSGKTPAAVKHSVSRAKKYLAGEYSPAKTDVIYPLILFIVKISLID